MRVLIVGLVGLAIAWYSDLRPFLEPLQKYVDVDKYLPAHLTGIHDVSSLGWTLLASYLILEGIAQVALKRRASKSAAARIKEVDAQRQAAEEKFAETKKLYDALHVEQRRAGFAIEEHSATIAEQTQEIESLRKALAASSQEAERAKAQSLEQSASSEGVVRFVSLLQERGRFVDFTMEDISRYTDEQVGAAARVVHQGCASVIKECFQIAPIETRPEGSGVTLGVEYDATEYRVLGKVVDPPLQGTLLHRGWRAGKVNLPVAVSNNLKAKAADIIAPAEVEVA